MRKLLECATRKCTMDSLSNHNCPVCGYDLGFSPWVSDSASDEICPCCGIQFGYDDAAGGDLNKRYLIYNKWRKGWLEEKMPWRSVGIKKPSNWDPEEQLKNLEKI